MQGNFAQASAKAACSEVLRSILSLAARSFASQAWVESSKPMEAETTRLISSFPSRKFLEFSTRTVWPSFEANSC